MDNDFDTPKALAVIFDFVKEVNKKGGSKKSFELMKEFDKVLGILNYKEKKISNEIKKLIKDREKARKLKDYNKADKIRNELKKKGVILEDTKQGVKLKFK